MGLCLCTNEHTDGGLLIERWVKQLYFVRSGRLPMALPRLELLTGDLDRNRFRVAVLNV